jgi:hypothetical protein
MIDLSGTVPQKPEMVQVVLDLSPEEAGALRIIGMEKGRTPSEVVGRWITAWVITREKMEEHDRRADQEDVRQ